MKPRRPKPEYAIATTLEEMANRFVYPDIDTVNAALVGGGGGGMAHYLIVSDTEQQEVQDKADFICPSVNSSATLQGIFDAIEGRIGNNGSASIWMAGIFELDSDVTTSGRCWVRGLGHTLQQGSE